VGDLTKSIVGADASLRSWIFVEVGDPSGERTDLRSPKGKIEFEHVTFA